MDNRTLQENEIEALSAIYGQDWCVVDASNNVFSITLDNGDPLKQITLEIQLPPDYPLLRAPYYTLSAPWMSREKKSLLIDEFSSIYARSGGDNIIYSWIEKAKEFLTDNDTLQREHDNMPNGELNSTNDYEQDESNTHCYNYRYHQNSNEKSKYQLTFYHGEPIIDRRSIFQAHCASVNSLEQVKDALVILMKNHQISQATYHIQAYRIEGLSSHTCIQDCNDNEDDTQPASQLLHLMEILDVRNVLVVVTQWFGGTKLGTDRLKHINNAAKDLLDKCGYINHQESNERGKKKKGK